MPVTLPAHPAAVLPVKLACPAGVDGVAIVIGALAPDLAYAFVPWWPFGPSHAPAALAYWSVPVAVLLTLVVRRLVLPAALLLPDLGELRLRDYAISARVRHRPLVTVGSALVGAVSHLAWDHLTHVDGAARWLPVLATSSPVGVPWYDVAQHGSGLLGTVVTGCCLWRVGRGRMLRRWHGEPTTDPPPPAAWWPLALGIAAASTVVAVLLPDGLSPHVLMARLLLAAIAAAAVATALTCGRATDNARWRASRWTRRSGSSRRPRRR